MIGIWIEPQQAWDQEEQVDHRPPASARDEDSDLERGVAMARQVLACLSAVSAREEDVIVRLCAVTSGTDRPAVLGAVGEVSMSHYMLDEVRVELARVLWGARCHGVRPAGVRSRPRMSDPDRRRLIGKIVFHLIFWLVGFVLIFATLWLQGLAANEHHDTPWLVIWTLVIRSLDAAGPAYRGARTYIPRTKAHVRRWLLRWSEHRALRATARSERRSARWQTREIRTELNRIGPILQSAEWEIAGMIALVRTCAAGIGEPVESEDTVDPWGTTDAEAPGVMLASVIANLEFALEYVRGRCLTSLL